MTFFDYFNLPETADYADCKHVYLKMAKDCHPDSGGSIAKFEELQSVWSVCSLYFQGDALGKPSALIPPRKFYFRHASLLKIEIY